MSSTSAPQSGDPAVRLKAVEQWGQVTIVGVGLLGGSLSAALGQVLPNVEFVGVDHPDVLEQPEALSRMHRGVALGDTVAVEAAFQASDMVFLAAPVAAIARWLPTALDLCPLVTDCGSTKRSLVEVAHGHPRRGYFVPGHPMAGALGGLAGAHGGLFRGQPWVLCEQGVQPEALRAVRQVVAAVGGQIVSMTAAEHDRVVAWTSHVPRLVASCLLGVAADTTAFAAAGPAFERLVRGAGGSSSMWADILASNRDEVGAALQTVIGELQACARTLQSEGSLRPVVERLEVAEKARILFTKQYRSGE